MTPPAPTDPSTSLEEAIGRELTPSPEDLAQVSKVCAALIKTAEQAARDLELPLVQALVAGSRARGTFLPGRGDIDLFLLFDPSLPRQGLERAGLQLGGKILENPEKRYAEHPYLRGEFQGVPVDAVPGYKVTRSDQPLTAVDRTPFHQAYLSSRQDDRLRSETRLLKRFLMGLGVYGADTRTEGFSGYLVELLILQAGSFRGLVQQAATWRIPQRLSPAGPDPVTVPDVALILSDPVDLRRNVASAVSRRSLALVILAARAYLEAPRREFFFPPPVPPLSAADVAPLLARRGTVVLALGAAAPDLVPDILVPQLRKCERALAEAGRRWGCEVYGTSSAAVNGRLAVLVELDRALLPPTEGHDGPPAGVSETSRFLSKWTEPARSRVQGPYVTPEGRLRVEVPRTERRVAALLQEALPGLGLGRDLHDPVGLHGKVTSVEENSGAPEVLAALDGLWRKGLPWLDLPRAP